MSILKDIVKESKFVLESSEEVFILKRGDGSFIDKGGRRTLKKRNARMFKSQDKAQKFLDGGMTNIYVKPGTNLDDVKIVSMKLNESLEQDDYQELKAAANKAAEVIWQLEGYESGIQEKFMTELNKALDVKRKRGK